MVRLLSLNGKNLKEKNLKNLCFYSVFILTKLFLFYIINKHFRCAIKYADMAQLVEHILGKDEVTGSIPVSSSKKKSTAVAVLFFLEMKRADAHEK